MESFSVQYLFLIYTFSFLSWVIKNISLRCILPDSDVFSKSSDSALKKVPY